MLELDKYTFDFIEKLQIGAQSYKLATIIPGVVIDSATFRMVENGNYELLFSLEPDNINEKLDLDYFFQRPFMLATKEGISILVQNSDIPTGKKSIADGKPVNYNIEVKAFKGDADETLWKQSSQTAYFRYDENQFHPYESGICFDLQTDSKDNGSYNALKLNVDNIELLFYYESVTPQFGYYIFRPNGIIDFDKFQQIIECVITAYGFLNGDYFVNKAYYFSKKVINGEGKFTYRYENTKRSIKTNSPIIDSGYYKDIADENLQLTSSQFDNLVNLLYKNEEYLRSSLLLINAGILKGCAKASLATVALETITNKIGANLSTKKIIENKEIINQLRYELNKTLKSFSDRINKEQLDTILAKLNQINSKPNRNKLEDAFQLIGVPLDEDEKECINYRNLFLHGSLPRKNEEMWTTDTELLDIAANRLVMLSSILLLKQAGYNGMVIDKGMTEVLKLRMIKNFQKVRSGNCLRSIATTKL